MRTWTELLEVCEADARRSLTEAVADAFTHRQLAQLLDDCDDAEIGFLIRERADDYREAIDTSEAEAANDHAAMVAEDNLERVADMRKAGAL